MDSIILMLTAMFSSMLTFYVNIYRKQGPVRSSALLTFVVAAFFYLFPELLSPSLTKAIPVVFIGGSFIGMVSASKVAKLWRIAMSGLVFGFIFLHTSRFFDGYGGALGTAACIAVLVVMGIPFIRTNRKMSVGFLKLRRMLFNPKKQQHVRLKKGV